VIDDYMMVSFAMMDISDEESIEDVLYRIDHCTQYGIYVVTCQSSTDIAVAR
jgi:hypothetical protein